MTDSVQKCHCPKCSKEVDYKTITVPLSDEKRDKIILDEMRHHHESRGGLPQDLDNEEVIVCKECGFQPLEKPDPWPELTALARERDYTLNEMDKREHRRGCFPLLVLFIVFTAVLGIYIGGIAYI